MPYLIIEKSHGKTICFDEVDKDGDVCIEASDDFTIRFFIKKQEAQKIIDHLKEQFEL